MVVAVVCQYASVWYLSPVERLSREAWARAALDALALGGPDAVKVERVARALEVTKGSFYWHFRDANELIAAAVALWEQEQTEGVIARMEAVADPRERLASLLEVAHGSARGLRIGRALGAFATHPVIGPAVVRVTSRRLDYIAACYRALGRTATAALHAARLAYASWLGLAELDALGLGLGDPEMRRAYLREMLATLLPKKRSR